MTGEIRSLEEARAARLTAAAAISAARYVGLAEEAIAQIPNARDADDRAAICWISEAWLELAEAALEGRS